MDGDKIIAGMGEIENDFHDRKDLSANICTVYTEPEYRCLGIAGELLDYVVEDNRKRGIMPLYLVYKESSLMSEKQRKIIRA